MARRIYKRPLVPYGKRNARLRRDGLASSYKEYLASPLWAEIRAKVLERDGGLCRICGDKAHAVHHSSYGKHTLSGRNLVSLFSVCSPCHRFIEFDRDGNKVHIREVGHRVYLLLRLKGRPPISPVQQNIQQFQDEQRKANRAAKDSPEYRQVRQLTKQINGLTKDDPRRQELNDARRQLRELIRAKR